MSKRRHFWIGLHEVRPLDRPDISFEAVDSTIMKAVYSFGIRGYEGVLADVWQDLCRTASNILEIGGNIGFYTVIGGESTNGRYTVLEPVPELTEVLCANLRRNRIVNVDVLEAAAIPAAEPRTVELNVPDEGVAAPVGAHLLDETEVSLRRTARTITVRGIPFAQLVAGCDLIKIDAEGIEAGLLAAGWKTLTQRLPILVLEILPEAKDLAGLVRKLAFDHGYQIHVVPSYGTEQIVTIDATEFSSLLPARYNSKDIILTQTPLAIARGVT